MYIVKKEPTVGDINYLQEQIDSLNPPLSYNASLLDVNMAGLADGNIPKWDATAQEWKPSADSSGIPDVVDNQNYVRNVGQWDTLASTTEITNLQTDIQNLQNLFPLELKDLSDINPTLTPTTGQILRFNGTFWTSAAESPFPECPQDNKKYARGTPNAWIEVKDIQTLNGLTDVDITGLVAGKILKWDGTKWVVSDDNSGIQDAPSDGFAYR